MVGEPPWALGTEPLFADHGVEAEDSEEADADAEAEAETHEKADDGFELVLCTQFSVADYQELHLTLTLTTDPNLTLTLIFTHTLSQP